MPKCTSSVQPPQNPHICTTNWTLRLRGPSETMSFLAEFVGGTSGPAGVRALCVCACVCARARLRVLLAWAVAQAVCELSPVFGWGLQRLALQCHPACWHCVCFCYQALACVGVLMCTCASIPGWPGGWVGWGGVALHCALCTSKNSPEPGRPPSSALRPVSFGPAAFKPCVPPQGCTCGGCCTPNPAGLQPRPTSHAWQQQASSRAFCR